MRTSTGSSCTWGFGLGAAAPTGLSDRGATFEEVTETENSACTDYLKTSSAPHPYDDVNPSSGRVECGGTIVLKDLPEASDPVTKEFSSRFNAAGEVAFGAEIAIFNITHSASHSLCDPGEPSGSNGAAASIALAEAAKGKFDLKWGHYDGQGAKVQDGSADLALGSRDSKFFFVITQTQNSWESASSPVYGSGDWQFDTSESRSTRPTPQAVGYHGEALFRDEGEEGLIPDDVLADMVADGIVDANGDYLDANKWVEITFTVHWTQRQVTAVGCHCNLCQGS